MGEGLVPTLAETSLALCFNYWECCENIGCEGGILGFIGAVEARRGEVVEIISGIIE